MRILYWGMQRALGGALLWVGLGGAAVLLVDGVERSRLLVEGQNLGVWGMDLLHRLPVLLREIVPLLIVVGVVWSQAVSRNRGEWLGLQTTGVSPSRLAVAAAVGGGLGAVAGAVFLEGFVPPVETLLPCGTLAWVSSAEVPANSRLLLWGSTPIWCWVLVRRTLGRHDSAASAMVHSVLLLGSTQMLILLMAHMEAAGGWIVGALVAALVLGALSPGTSLRTAVRPTRSGPAFPRE